MDPMDIAIEFDPFVGGEHVGYGRWKLKREQKYNFPTHNRSV